VLCLVNDSDPPVEAWRETYDSHRRHWRQCLDRVAADVDGYLIRSIPDMPSDWAVSRANNTFAVRQREAFQTMFHKLTRAVELLLCDQHDWVVYTGLSSLYDLPLLCAGREPARPGVYAGHLVDGTYPSGGGVLFSPDVARALVEMRAHHDSGWNDVAIWQVLTAAGFQPQHREMFVFDYGRGLEQLDQVEPGRYLCYRMRDYDDPRRERERGVMAAVFEKLYGAATW
jgi:hypothetical protein